MEERVTLPLIPRDVGQTAAQSDHQYQREVQFHAIEHWQEKTGVE